MSNDEPMPCTITRVRETEGEGGRRTAGRGRERDFIYVYRVRSKSLVAPSTSYFCAISKRCYLNDSAFVCVPVRVCAFNNI